jgi:hypothetical protein
MAKLKPRATKYVPLSAVALTQGLAMHDPALAIDAAVRSTLVIGKLPKPVENLLATSTSLFQVGDIAMMMHGTPRDGLLAGCAIYLGAALRIFGIRIREARKPAAPPPPPKVNLAAMVGLALLSIGTTVLGLFLMRWRRRRTESDSSPYSSNLR